MDVNGSYLYKKYRTLTKAGEVTKPPQPSPSLSGWRAINSNNLNIVGPRNSTVISDKLFNIKLIILHSVVCHTGLVYTYLASHVGHSSEQDAFRTLTRGYNLWQDWSNYSEHRASRILSCALLNKAIDEGWIVLHIDAYWIRSKIGDCLFSCFWMCCWVCSMCVNHNNVTITKML